MTSVVVTRTMSHPPQTVWDALADFGGIHRWSAAIESSPINEGAPETGIGAERYCSLYDGNHIQERITEFKEGDRLGIEVFDISMPLKNVSASFDVKPTDSGGTELTMTWTYTVKMGPIGAVMDALMLRKAMTGSVTRLLAALDEHLRTGEPIERGWKPDAA